MKSARSMYTAANTTSPTDKNTSLIDNWWMDWNIVSNTGILAITPATIATCRLETFLRRCNKSQAPTKRQVNSHKNGKTSNGNGSLSGSVVIKNKGPEIYRAISAPYLLILCLVRSWCIQEVYKNMGFLSQFFINVLTNEKHRFGHGARLVNKLGARTINPPL